jgi:hypothetical protein
LIFTAFDETAIFAEVKAMTTGGSYMETVLEGFREPEELSEIQELMQKDKLLEAREEATALTKRASESFPSVKHERFLRGSCLYLLGLIAAKLGDSEGSIRYMEAASDLGHPFAPYRAAAHLLIEGAISDDSMDLREKRDKAFHYYLMGAELGDVVCIDHIQLALRAKGKKSQEQYWFLLKRMSEEEDPVRQFAHFYHTTYTAKDRLFLDKVMKEESLSGGPCPSTITGIPGRSTLVSAYIDLIMRKQLRFVWLAFFQDTGMVESHPMMQVFDGYREVVRRNPLADLFLLVNQKYAADKSTIALKSDQVLENMLAGDQIMVQFGRLAHYAIVWAVDKDNQRVLLLDPFDEFWQPSHNSCVTFFDRKAYKHNRHLVHLSLTEVQQMLVVVMTIRDRNSANEAS